MEHRALGRVVEMLVPGLQGRHFRVYHEQSTVLASLVTLQEDGSTWCPTCQSGQCRHSDHVAWALLQASA